MMSCMSLLYARRCEPSTSSFELFHSNLPQQRPSLVVGDFYDGFFFREVADLFLPDFETDLILPVSAYERRTPAAIQQIFDNSVFTVGVEESDSVEGDAYVRAASSSAARNASC